MRKTEFKILLSSLFIFFVFGCGGCKKKVKTLPPQENQQAPETKTGSQNPFEPEQPTPIQKEIYWSQVAGSFYPAEPSVLKSMMEKFLSSAQTNDEIKGRDLVGFISPHAGYRYSGPVAAWGYKQLEGRKIHTAIVLGFNHRSSPSTSSILPYKYYRTPLGNVKIDTQLKHRLLKMSSGQLRESSLPFGREHSLETQLPFLQKVAPEAMILPIMVAHPGGRPDEKLAELLYKAVGNRKDILVIASTDLSHYQPYEVAVKKDKLTLKWIEQMQWSTIQKAGPWANIMCGYFTVGVLLKFLSHYDSSKLKGKLIKYANSGDITGKKEAGVVGYGVVAFSLPNGIRTRKADSENEEIKISDESKRFLYEVARSSIMASLTHKNFTVPTPPAHLKQLQTNAGAIVRIKIDRRISGEGYELSMKIPVFRAVAEAAARAVMEDDRYPTPPLSKFPDMEIRIFCIFETQPHAPQLLKTIENFGDDGIMIKGMSGRGIVAPQEASLKGWNKDQMLSRLCMRANLPFNCYKKPEKKNIIKEIVRLKGVML